MPEESDRLRRLAEATAEESPIDRNAHVEAIAREIDRRARFRDLVEAMLRRATRFRKPPKERP
jgi:hypothetical protein